MIELIRQLSTSAELVGSLAARSIDLVAKITHEIDGMMAAGSISNARHAARAAELRREMIAALTTDNGSLERTA